MTQPTTQPVTTPPPASDDQANPLDKLEELIKNAQQNAPAGGQAGASPAMPGMPTMPGAPRAASGEPAPLSPEQQVQEDEKQLEKIEALKAQKAEEEKVLIQQRQEMIKQTVAESPQTGKREQVKQEKLEEEQQSNPGGYEIKQLSHMKIKKSVG